MPNVGLKRIYNAFFNSMSGLDATWRHEEAFRQEIFITIILVPTALILCDSLVHTVLLIFSVFLVLIVELLNTCVEAVVDRISTEHHELSKRAKDIGSAAVFVSLILLIIVWSLTILDMFF